ncbi:MAG: hypothetical protein R3268_13305, partial [Acidiferrobacterales bacterium]|nr:hypothetical protein [Acidiferrobacterales bacterium]
DDAQDYSDFCELAANHAVPMAKALKLMFDELECSNDGLCSDGDPGCYECGVREHVESILRGDSEGGRE